jgi:hypothetical protein
VNFSQYFVDFDYQQHLFENFHSVNLPIQLITWKSSPSYRQHLHYGSTNSIFQVPLLPLRRFDLIILDKPRNDRLTCIMENSRDSGCILLASMDND